MKQQLILQQYPQLEAAARNMKLKAELSLLNNLSSCPGSTYRAQEKRFCVTSGRGRRITFLPPGRTTSCFS